MLMELSDRDFNILYGDIIVKIDNEDTCRNCIYRDYCIPDNVLADIGNEIIVACRDKSIDNNKNL